MIKINLIVNIAKNLSGFFDIHCIAYVFLLYYKRTVGRA